MNTFIKATEIWEPNRERTELTLINGQYGSYKAFESYSHTMTFAYDEGLPGKAWAAKHPLILTELHNSCFQRTEIAEKIGITAAVAVPIFAGEYLHAVVLFLCGDKEKHSGAIEIWAKEPEHRRDMELVDGYFGTMKEFERISKRTKIMRGNGLPGIAWETKMPCIIRDLSSSTTFLRAKNAAKDGISTGLALPVWMIEEDGYVINFLSAKGTPIARRFEIWISDDTGEALIFRDGYCDEVNDLNALYALKRYGKEVSLIGQVWKTGHPMLTDKPDITEDGIAFDSLLILPILQNGFCKAVVTFYN